MRERLLGVWDSIKALWERLSRIARIVLLIAIVGVIGVVIALTIFLNQKNYVLLNNDFSTAERVQALAVLAEQGIEARVEPNGYIMVLDKDLDKARMQLATAGLPGGIYDGGYSPGLTSTQSDKNYLQNQELQKRLQSAVESFDEVDQAVVTISQPERSAFALQTDVVPPTANISIRRKTGRELSAQQLQGILNIVRYSVAGLTEDSISITDSELGDLMSQLSQASNASDAKLRLTDEVNSTARNKALSLLRLMFGAENVEVQVHTVLDTDYRNSTSITYHPLDPENPQNNPLDYGEHYRDAVTGEPGVAQGIPGANDNIGTPEYGEITGEGAETTNYSFHDIYDYLVSSTKEEMSKEGLVITGATAAVLINQVDLATGVRDQVAAMVANATGVAVENITVVNYQFQTGPELPAIPGGMTPRQILTLVLIGVAVLAILIVVIIVIITKKKKKQEEEALAAEELEAAEELLSLEGEEFDPITLVETQEQKLRSQIKDLADSDPEIVASLLKNWLSG